MPRSILDRLFRVATLVMLALALIAPVVPVGAQEASGDAAESAESAPDTQQALSQLIEVLRDDTAREALITELEAQMGDGAPEASAEPPNGDTALDAELRSIGGRIGEMSRDAVEGISGSLIRLWAQLVATPQIFAGLNLAELDALGSILLDVAILVAITYGGLLLFRLLIGMPRERLRMLFRNGGWIAKPIAVVLELALDIVAALVPYAIGYLIAVSLLGAPGQISIEHTLYLNAFLMVEVVLSILRTVVSPNLPEQRLLRLRDTEAKAVMGWGRLLITLFGFGQMLVLPLLTATVSFAAGRAISVVLLLFTLLVAAVAVLVAREPVQAKLARMIDNNEARKGLAILTHNWHVFVLVYIGVLVVVALTRTSVEFQDYVWSNAQIVIAVVAGFVVLNVLKTALGKGVTLPSSMRRKSPELQRQLNAIVPVVLKVLRFVVIVAVVVFCLNGLGFFNFLDFLESEFGARVVGSALTIALILAFAIAAWIGMNTWVDSQINPELAPAATARKRTLFALMRNALTIALIVITLMFVLSEVGINIAPLLASAGVLGLAIGFGAQKLVQDIITGIFIQLEGAIDVGDVVSIGGISGVVERLTIRSASLRDVEGSYHIIPFSSVDTVTNFMRGFSFALIDMGIGYRENTEDAKQAMFDAFTELRADPDHKLSIMEDFEWLGVNAFGASEVVLRARIKTLPGKQWGVKRAYNAIVKRIFDERDIEIPFPHQTLYFGVGKDGKAPPMHMVREDQGEPAPETDTTIEGEAVKSKPSPKKRQTKRKQIEGKQIEGKDMPDVDEGPDGDER